MACISRKFEGFSFWPTGLRYAGSHRDCRNACRTDQRVDLVPVLAEDVHQLGQAARRRQVPMAERDETQREDPQRVGSSGTSRPLAVAPTVRPRKIVTMFISSFCSRLVRGGRTTPHSFIRLPSMRHTDQRSRTAAAMQRDDHGDDHDREDDTSPSFGNRAQLYAS